MRNLSRADVQALCVVFTSTDRAQTDDGKWKPPEQLDTVLREYLIQVEAKTQYAMTANFYLRQALCENQAKRKWDASYGDFTRIIRPIADGDERVADVRQQRPGIRLVCFA